MKSSRKQRGRGRQAPMSRFGGRWSDDSLSSRGGEEEWLCAEGKGDHRCSTRTTDKVRDNSLGVSNRHLVRRSCCIIGGATRSGMDRQTGLEESQGQGVVALGPYRWSEQSCHPKRLGA